MLIDGVPYPVYAELEGHIERHQVTSFGGRSQASGFPAWRGTLRTDAQDLTWTFRDAGELILRVEDEREGPFTVIDEVIQDGVLHIRGNGAAPFDI